MAIINTESSKQKAVSRIRIPASCLLPLARNSRGFALLISVIFMSVMLSIGLALGSLGYKQQTLSSSAIRSQYAFYAADSALECALYADQQQGLFAFKPDTNASVPGMSCSGYSPYSVSNIRHTSSEWVMFNRVKLDNDTRCADVTIYKQSAGSGGATTVYSQGYDISCATLVSPNGARFVSRGLYTRY